MNKSKQEQWIDFLGRIILNGNLSKEDRQIALDFRDEIINKEKYDLPGTLQQCRFQEAWIGRCKEVTNTYYCSKHIGLQCTLCVKQASHNCDATIGPMVCGANLCDNCRCRH